MTETIENLFIPLDDGVRLAARLWLPDGAGEKPVPAILEYIPYRKRDGTRGRDEPMLSKFAAHGYAAIRVDLRGAGDSEGLLADEYLPRELDDAVEVIAWIARQPWCDGKVGMMGKSWGGFNALQVAALRPPALKAIVTVCSTDDRYADDVHYMGGCLLNDNLWWGAIMLAYQGRPPDPAVVGEPWRAEWLKRLDAMPHWPALWLAHQRRDAYWRHGSVCEDYSAIQCPVFVVGGWADSYTNAVSRLLAGLRVPRLGLIGPWAHLYPHDGAPGPAIGFLQEALRWWDHWLKGVDRGIMREPMLRAYVEAWTPPGDRDPAPGRWVGEETWPSTRIGRRVWAFGPEGLALDGVGAGKIALRSPAYTGSGAGEWMGTGVEGQSPYDQRVDDGLSRVFDSAPLAEGFDLLGAPEIELEIQSDKPVAQLVARLCDVAPDGSSRRVSYAVLNLTHRDSHAAPEPLPVGEAVRVRLRLNDCGYAFAPGHVVRLALSNAYWPLIWPAPEAATLTICAPGALSLPLRPLSVKDTDVSFESPERGVATPTAKVAESEQSRRVSLDLLTGDATYDIDNRGGLFGEGVIRFEETGTTLSHDMRRAFAIAAEDPLAATYVVSQTYEIGRDGWRIRLESRSEMTATASHFHLRSTLTAFENGQQAASRAWADAIARDCV
jgi:uncharacterized protein